jgi:hypothetical protein
LGSFGWRAQDSFRDSLAPETSSRLGEHTTGVGAGSRLLGLWSYVGANRDASVTPDQVQRDAAAEVRLPSHYKICVG